MTTIAMSRTELDPLRCGAPGCECDGPLTLSPACHRGEPVWATYDWTSGLLTMTCSICAQFVASIAVADHGTPMSCS